MAWTQVADQFGSITRINAIASLAGELYGAANNGALLKWDGISDWVQVAAPLGSYVNATSLVEYSGKLWAILHTVGSAKGRLHHFNGTSWATTSPATPSGVNCYFLSVYNNRLFVAYDDTAVTGYHPAAMEYVGTSTYTIRGGYNSGQPSAFYAGPSLWIAVGFASGVFASAICQNSSSVFFTPVTISGATEITAITSDGSATFYVADINGRLYRDTSGANGTFSLVASTPNTTPITSLKWHNGSLYAGLSTS